MTTAAQLKKELSPVTLVGKGALAKLSAEDLASLAALVKANQLSSLVLNVENKRLVKLKAKVNVAAVTGTAHVKAMDGLKSLYLQWGKAGLVATFEDGFFDTLESAEFQAGVVDHIPPGLLFQPALRVLEIHNTVVALPEKVDWPRLQVLRVGSAGTSMPPCLLLPSLTSLAISAEGSRLETLPENFGDLGQLELLDLSRNPLRALPESMAKLSRLKHLILTETKLRALPGWLADLPSLETLSVDGPLPAALQRFARG